MHEGGASSDVFVPKAAMMVVRGIEGGLDGSISADGLF